MSANPITQALTQQATDSRRRLDRARNLVEKRDRRIRELEAENAALRARLEGARHGQEQER